MRLLVALAWLLVSGCVVPGPPADVTFVSRLPGVCAMPLLNVTPAEVEVGDSVRIEAALVNCGEEPLEFWGGGCRTPPGLAVDVDYQGVPHRLSSTSPSALPSAPAGFGGPCGPPRLAPEQVIEPGDRIAARWEWNGSLEKVYAWWTPLHSPSPGYSVKEVAEVGAPKAGGYALSIAYTDPKGELTWSRRATLWIHGEGEYAGDDGMTGWRDDPGAVASGTAPLPPTRSPIVELAANASLQSRWPARDATLLSIEEAPGHYITRHRLTLRGIGETYDVAIAVSADGHPLRGPVPGLPDCRESQTECEFGFTREDARLAAGGPEPALVWHTVGGRGTFAWRVGEELFDANDGREIIP